MLCLASPDLVRAGSIARATTVEKAQTVDLAVGLDVGVGFGFCRLRLNDWSVGWIMTGREAGSWANTLFSMTRTRKRGATDGVSCRGQVKS